MTVKIGRYWLSNAIAAGGMATVHLGQAIDSREAVAIKRLHPHLAEDPHFAKMFLDEARLSSRIQHPNVVATLDVASEGQELFIVMEYVHGEALSRLLPGAHASGDASVRVLVGIMIGALHGLHAAHEATSETGERLGLVHRDISPQNILVGADGIARVVDFGIAKAASRVQSTRNAEMKGKIAYMAPEQIRRQMVDRRADVYAAGVVLWESLTGRRLFEAEEPAGIMHAALHDPVVKPSSWNARLPPEVDAIVMRAIARDPGERFETALEMAAALERVRFAPASEIGAWVQRHGAENLAARERRIAEMDAAHDQTLFATETPARPAPRRRRVAPAFFLVGALTAASTVGALVLARREAETAPMPTASVVSPAPILSESVQPAATLSVSPEPARTVSARPRALPRATSPRASASTKPDGCNPPFFFDANGNRVFKKECL